MVPAGCFIAAVGADNPDKQELDPALFATARILIDDLDQCAEGGDLAHAIRAGTATPEDVAATLADLAAGAQPGRTGEDQIVIFDSTGIGIQDVAATATTYEAIQVGNG
jgi:alanine dehydrogenase